jgi:hypothetical protein
LIVKRDNWKDFLPKTPVGRFALASSVGITMAFFAQPILFTFVAGGVGFGSYYVVKKWLDANSRSPSEIREQQIAKEMGMENVSLPFFLRPLSFFASKMMSEAHESMQKSYDVSVEAVKNSKKLTRKLGNGDLEFSQPIEVGMASFDKGIITNLSFSVRGTKGEGVVRAQVSIEGENVSVMNLEFMSPNSPNPIDIKEDQDYIDIGYKVKK